MILQVKVYQDYLDAKDESHSAAFDTASYTLFAMFHVYFTHFVAHIRHEFPVFTRGLLILEHCETRTHTEKPTRP